MTVLKMEQKPFGYAVIGTYKDGTPCVIEKDRGDSGYPQFGGDLGHAYNQTLLENATERLKMVQKSMRSYYGHERVDFESFGIYPVALDLEFAELRQGDIEGIVRRNRIDAAFEKNKNTLSPKQIEIVQKGRGEIPDLSKQFSESSVLDKVKATHYLIAVNLGGDYQFLYNPADDVGAHCVLDGEIALQPLSEKHFWQRNSATIEGAIGVLDQWRAQGEQAPAYLCRSLIKADRQDVPEWKWDATVREEALSHMPKDLSEALGLNMA